MLNNCAATVQNFGNWQSYSLSNL